LLHAAPVPLGNGACMKIDAFSQVSERIDVCIPGYTFEIMRSGECIAGIRFIFVNSIHRRKHDTFHQCGNTMKNPDIVSTIPLGFTWDTVDPFLFCVHHADAYPRGNRHLGPDVSLEGRTLGNDFQLKDGWRMYHGEHVPGFPSHPHRGFETVTVVLQGFVDHSDSHGAAGRYGNGDVQWMTAGSGLQHCEMFPLLNREAGNPLELFQIWLNLPQAKKMVAPHFKMLWGESIPTYSARDEAGKRSDVTIIAGRLGNLHAPDPAPDSYAADAGNELAIWIISIEAGGRCIMPAASHAAKRRLYFFEGDAARVNGYDIPSYHAVDLPGNVESIIESGGSDIRLLLLQGKPINEPVVQYGPFVMNTRKEIEKAFEDYRATQFGGWPWDTPDHVHPHDAGRFARYSDGRIEKP